MATGYGKRVRRTMVDFVAGKAPTAPANWFPRLCQLNPGDDASGTSSSTTGEPTIGTGNYGAASDMTSGGWTAAPDPSVDTAAVSANASAITFPTSSAAWTTTTSTLGFWWMSLSATSKTEANYIGRGSVTNPVAVNTSGVTLSFAIAALSFTCISV